MFAVDVSVVDLGIQSQRKLGMTVASLGDADEEAGVQATLAWTQASRCACRNGCAVRESGLILTGSNNL